MVFPEIPGLTVTSPVKAINAKKDNCLLLEVEDADDIHKKFCRKINAVINPGTCRYDRKMQLKAFNWFSNVKINFW